MLTELKNDDIQQEYQRLIAYSNDEHNSETYACMLASLQYDLGAMPDALGLDAEEFNQLLSQHFPRLVVQSIRSCGREADETRNDERDEVYKLLLGHRANLSGSELWMAKIVAIACQAHDHLWQDMGLWSRNQLSELLMHNFPSLASMNTKNMKWKKFIYKQLCITEGIYTCRAPSCEVCADYDQCFGDEE